MSEPSGTCAKPCEEREECCDCACRGGGLQGLQAPCQEGRGGVQRKGAERHESVCCGVCEHCLT